jgi:hypothetical protein
MTERTIHRGDGIAGRCVSRRRADQGDVQVAPLLSGLESPERGRSRGKPAGTACIACGIAPYSSSKPPQRWGEH